MLLYKFDKLSSEQQYLNILPKMENGFARPVPDPILNSRGSKQVQSLSCFESLNASVRGKQVFASFLTHYKYFTVKHDKASTLLPRKKDAIPHFFRNQSGFLIAVDS